MEEDSAADGLIDEREPKDTAWWRIKRLFFFFFTENQKKGIGENTSDGEKLSNVSHTHLRSRNRGRKSSGSRKQFQR